MGETESEESADGSWVRGGASALMLRATSADRRRAVWAGVPLRRWASLFRVARRLHAAVSALPSLQAMAFRQQRAFAQRQAFARHAPT